MLFFFSSRPPAPVVSHLPPLPPPALCADEQHPADEGPPGEDV